MNGTENNDVFWLTVTWFCVAATILFIGYKILRNGMDEYDEDR